MCNKEIRKDNWAKHIKSIGHLNNWALNTNPDSAPALFAKKAQYIEDKAAAAALADDEEETRINEALGALADKTPTRIGWWEKAIDRRREIRAEQKRKAECKRKGIKYTPPKAKSPEKKKQPKGKGKQPKPKPKTTKGKPKKKTKTKPQSKQPKPPGPKPKKGKPKGKKKKKGKGKKKKNKDDDEKQTRERKGQNFFVPFRGFKNINL